MPLELAPLVEGTEGLTVLDELTSTPEIVNPALYPSSRTFPSTRTFPSSGSVTPATGLFLEAMSEGAETLTPLVED